ncbi:hypothetical protein [Parvibaculum sp.]|uniref:hypothetical protein n=1 Tax=Parvibaculum sp. TaxID=2024848 RepID=UPI003919E9D4
MCFNSSKSSAASSNTTTTRDERIAADNASEVFSAKDISTYGNSSVALTYSSVREEVSPEIIDAGFAYAADIAEEMRALSQAVASNGYAAFDETIEFADRTSERNAEAYSGALSFADEQNERVWAGLTGILDDALTFASGRSGAALDFARDTQAAYQEAAANAATQDATEMAKMLVQYTSYAVIAFFAFQVFGKGL